MAEVKVIASVGNADYELAGESNLYQKEIAAPNETENILVTAIDESGNEAYGTATLEVFPEWMPPKTDWTESDYFNAKDYNRIIGNMKYLETYLGNLFLGVTEVSLGDNKTYESLIYAREMNAIENSLEKLNLETYKFDIGDTKEYKANGATPLWSEFNRIESAMLLLYKTIMAHKEALPKLSFGLGKKKGIKV